MSPVPASPRARNCARARPRARGRHPSCCCSHSTSPGSTLRERVAITRPSSGVKPIVVSTERPPCTARSDAPAPRWQVTIRSSPAAGRATRPPGATPRRGTARGTRTGARRTLPPLRGQRVGRGSRRQVAWNAVSKQATCGTPGQRPATASSAASVFGWCSGARSVRSSSAGRDAVVDHHRHRGTACRRAPRGGRRRRPSRDRASRRAARSAPSRSPEVALLEQPVAGVEQPQLQAARPGVHDEHRPLSRGQVQSRTSGASSPVAGVLPLRSRSSTIRCRTCAARAASAGHAVDDVHRRGGSGRGRSASPCRTASSSCPPLCSPARGCCAWLVRR